MPFKDPKTKREYHRLYMRRKELREAYDSMEFFGENGRPLRKPSLEELEVDLDLVWYGVKSETAEEIIESYRKFTETKYSVKEAAAKIGVHPNTLRKWIKDGKVKYIQEAPHSTIYIPESEIKRLKDNSGFKSSE